MIYNFNNMFFYNPDGDPEHQIRQKRINEIQLECYLAKAENKKEINKINEKYSECVDIMIVHDLYKLLKTIYESKIKHNSDKKIESIILLTFIQQIFLYIVGVSPFSLSFMTDVKKVLIDHTNDKFEKDIYKSDMRLYRKNKQTRLNQRTWIPHVRNLYTRLSKHTDIIYKESYNYDNLIVIANDIWDAIIDSINVKTSSNWLDCSVMDVLYENDYPPGWHY